LAHKAASYHFRVATRERAKVLRTRPREPSLERPQTTGEATMLELLERIYAAAADRAAWTGMLDDLSDRYRSVSAVRVSDGQDLLGRGKMVGGIADMVVSGIADAELASFRQHYWATSPVLPQILRHPEGSLASIYDFLPEREFMASEYYADWLAPQRLHYSIGARFRVTGHSNAFIALARARRAGDFTIEEAEEIGRLLPHIGQSLALGQHLHAVSLKAQGLQALLEQNGVVAVTLTREGKVADISDQAERVLRGCGLRLRDGVIALANPMRAEALRAAIKRVADGGIGETVLLGPGSDRVRPVQGRLCPLASPIAALGIGPRVLLVVEKALEPTNRLRDAVQEFGLSDAEARLALALVEGLDVNAYCERHGITRNTVKTQLSSIFDKTGVRRQIDLVRLLQR
jgi:DNA-binding CsgD family transcriptional regulator